MRVIGVYTKKGGVGKTQTAVDLAICLCKVGKRVLLVDYDPQRNINALLNIDDGTYKYSIYNAMQRQIDEDEPIDANVLIRKVQGISLIPGSPKLKMTNTTLQSLENSEFVLRGVLKDYEEEFDFCIIDCNPHLENLGKNVLLACDSIIIPTELSYLSALGIADVNKEIEQAKSVNPKLRIEGILYTKIKSNTKSYKEYRESFKEGFTNIKVFESQIPFSQDVENASSAGMNLIDFKPKSKVSMAYRELTQEVLGEV